MQKSHWLLLVCSGIAIGLVSGCRSVSSPNEATGGCSLSSQVARTLSWVKARDVRGLKRIDAPEVPGVHLAFQDCTTNGTFYVNLFFETNRLTVVVDEGLTAEKKAREFELYCTLANQGRKFWHWLHDKESDTLGIQSTLYDYQAIGEVNANVVPQLVEIGESECRACGAVMRGLKKGELTPDEAWRGGPASETGLRLSATDSNLGLAEVYQLLWDALRDKEPVKWDGEARYPISFDIGIGEGVTTSTTSTNLTCWIRADRYYVEGLVFRKWGEGNKLEKFTPLVVRCNQNRGDGRWACVEGGEFCIRGTFPLPYVLADPRRFVTEFVLCSAGEILANEDAMRGLVPDCNVSP